MSLPATESVAPAQPEPLRVLLLEDDSVDRMAARRAVAGLDFSVKLTEATTLRQAIEMLKERPFDCLLLDYVLPDGNGMQLLERLPRHNGIACAAVMLTGEGDERLAAEAISLGADDYLPKKILSVSSLQRTLRNAMDKARLRADLANRSAEVRRRNQELEEFVYAISHDLQEPLRAITGFLQLIDQRYANELDEKGHAYINFAVEGGKRMSRMISGLLELSRVGHEESGQEWVDLNEVVADAIANLDAAIRESNARVEVVPMPTLWGNRASLMLLFQNLIGNAIKYRGEASPVVAVSVSPPVSTAEGDATPSLAAPHTNLWEFCVQDNGIGIDPRFHERVFAIFQRLNHREEYEGTGIGLALCKKIVQQASGRIWFEPRSNGGTCFYFAWPVGEQSTL